MQSCFVNYKAPEDFYFQLSAYGAGEMTQQLRTFVAFPEGLCLVLSTCIGCLSTCNSTPGDVTPFSDLCTHVAHTDKKILFKKNVCLCVCVFACLHGYRCLWRLEVSNPSGAGVKGSCNCPVDVWGTRLRFSVRTVCALNC